MTPYEIMLSESQERMLLVAKRGREAEVERIFEKWDLHAVRIGEVTADGILRVKDRGTVVAEIPNRALTDEAPVYNRPFADPAYVVGGAAPVAGGSAEARGRPATSCCSCWRRRAWPASAGSTGSTTTWSAPTRWCCRGWAPAWCA